MHHLIIKHGALGDVVRTSYFATPLRNKWGTDLRLSWITAPASLPLLQFHPKIDDLWTDFDQARSYVFDHVYSLDDEREVLQRVSDLRSLRLTGARLDQTGHAGYTDDAAEWFDMGLLSRFGKIRADQLKKANTSSHAQIYSRMFGVSAASPEFHGDRSLEAWAEGWVGSDGSVVGINAYAGGRWPSKELPAAEQRKLIQTLLDRECWVVLIGAGSDRQRNLALAKEFDDVRLRVANTDDSPLRLAAVIKQLDQLITSDSLPLHLAIAQRVRCVAFFAPTSAAEIDDFGCVRKLISTAPDYCSYRPDADNASITAQRLLPLLESAP